MIDVPLVIRGEATDRKISRRTIHADRECSRRTLDDGIAGLSRTETTPYEPEELA
jgi:hypothetical protein